MTQHHHEPDAGAAVPSGYEAAPHYPGQQQPHQTQQYQEPQSAPSQPYQGQGYPPPTPPLQYQGQYPQQPPMPNPAYGYEQPKSKLVAGLLGIFLGGLGVHRFYLGHTKVGVIQLLLTLIVGGFTFGLVALWGVIEGIMIIAGAAQFRTDAKGIPLRD